jgi:hypothetical protein
MDERDSMPGDDDLTRGAHDYACFAIALIILIALFAINSHI